ncbi:hypothetical protein M408DRAFT_30298 [Serendipita vermifera MAFF 305830]|uniref:Uncharacterized protein n=1 Tax=Serendipita vermifera MAFF 305830 TaxID=933852 RepID=A0A0C3A785_SERVB|nr:hypothetical protein M408DRAFT_30298 [Serendipita vermifera MAFF 305830]
MKSTSTNLIKSGVTLQLFGLLWGLYVPSTPFPRLALSAHLHSMTNGALLTVVGLVLRQTDLLTLNPLQSSIVTWGLNTAWISIASKCANAYWGTANTLPITAKVANAVGGLEWQEMIVLVSHLATLSMIPAFGVITWELFFGVKTANRGEKH